MPRDSSLRLKATRVRRMGHLGGFTERGVFQPTKHKSTPRMKARVRQTRCPVICRYQRVV